MVSPRWRVSGAITIVFVALFAIGAILLTVLSKPLDFTIGVTGWLAGGLSLFLYLRDRLSTQPVFLKILFDPVANTPNRWIIEANISNEGGVKESSCEVLVRGEGVPETKLNRVIVENSGGAGRAEPANDIIDVFPLFPHRPVWARGYVTAPQSTLIAIVLRVEAIEISTVSFHLSP